MQTVIVIISLMFSASLAGAQSPAAVHAYDEATQLARAGRFELAANAYKTALLSAGEQRHGEFIVRTHYNLGVCHYRTGDLTSAAIELQKALSLSHGKYRRAHYALGMTRSAAGEWADARDSFLRAIDLAPSDGEAWFDLAFAYLALHDDDDAAEAFRKAIVHQSIDAPVGHNNLGVLLALKGDVGGAEHEFNQALKASGGKLPEARINLEICRSMKNEGRKLVAEAGLRLAVRVPVV